MDELRQKLNELENEKINREIIEKELVESEQKFRMSHQQVTDIVEFLLDATLVIDKNKKLIAWNRACEKMTGVLKKDIIGKDYYSYSLPFYGKKIPLLIDYVNKDSEKLKNKYKSIKKTGNLLSAEAFVPKIYNEKGGYLSGVASLIFDKNGEIIGAIESIRDITEYIKAKNEAEKVR